MAEHLSTSNGTAEPNNSFEKPQTYTIKTLPKSKVFTTRLPPDSKFPTPAASHRAPRDSLGPRLVKEASYTFVRPVPIEQPELLAVSPRALQDLGIDPSEPSNPDFLATVAGNQILTWDEEKEEGIYPWAQCYGGYQFGQWAGQLGDGRAISLFEINSPTTGIRYELQLKGAGKTPYSRFADGKAVLRSSLREFVVSEALNALGIPTTRALSLVLAPNSHVRRETMEPGAICSRFAQSWIRIGTFDILRARGDRKLLRRTAEYVAEEVVGGWENLPGKLPPGDISVTAATPERAVPKDELQGEGKEQENRFARLYREIVRRNARTVAAWQAYGFMNGVLNTDNTSIMGLSMDYGPFAFMDNFDRSYTPNHDDHMLRYSYKNQTSIIWWNLVRLGESFGELIGAGDRCDDEEFITEGVHKDFAATLVERAETIITAAGEEYQAVFKGEYRRIMTARLGLKYFQPKDDKVYSDWLDTLEDLELDFNQSFRKLGNFTLAEIDTEEKRKSIAGRFFHHEGLTCFTPEDEARARMAAWLETWRTRVLGDWKEGHDAERMEAMRKTNPKFIPKGWILDEVISRVEHKGERDILNNIMTLALNPFEESWSWNKEEEERFCGDVPKTSRAMQCSCSS
ncbi:UPF0061-domain-containing protein [Patellaria atrata CBS 101060]|uniref:Selenoprotein O n=1 Tax=Patellaria atrata CBS 101060 TaxID=1346257 RepID=A0A9P4VUB2_9PEZI|nr:UPF0061-domain-containing protein [Patellaria atrata CBS 101060]